MAQQSIVNPLGAARTVSDFRLFKDATGYQLDVDRVVQVYRANDTIAIHNAVAWVAPTATVPLSVELLDVSDAHAALVFCGVALEAATAGQMIRICRLGPAIVTVDDGTPAFGEVCVKHASTDGCVISGGTLGGSWDGSDVAGTGLGVFLGAEIGSTNTAIMDVRSVL